jgi:hypothetical protein
VSGLFLALEDEGPEKAGSRLDSAKAASGGAAAKLLSKDETRRIAANIAKLPGFAVKRMRPAGVETDRKFADPSSRTGAALIQ